MAQISLHDYLQQINTLLEENRLSEAVAHCRHILKKFPRHVETYRLYGKALLEQQKFNEAVDIFQRVLSADPEDFISHVGLAITRKEKGEVPEAIWHFERAFEMDPYNAAIQEELRGLYAHRDGLRPERINLTRGALARLYFRGNLYQQAAAELRQILSQNGERLDLQTLLAETLWRDDQRVDVVDVCLRILDKTPYSIKANAILAEVWLVTGRSDEAQEYLQRLRMLTRPEKAHLDPDSVVGRAFGTNGQIELPERVLIEEMDYIPVAQEFSGETDWVKELGVETEEDEEANWLSELGEIDEAAFAEAAASDEDMLDWLREVAVSEGDAAVSEGDAFEEGDPDGMTDDLTDFEGERLQAAFGGDSDDDLDWLVGGDESDQEALADMPDWLSEVTASAEADMWNLAIEEGEEQAEANAADSIRPEAGGAKAQTPDWIRDVAHENVEVNPIESWQEEDQTLGEYGEADEIPDWMRGGGTTDFPDWLNESDELITAEDEALPDWLTQPEQDTGDRFPKLSIEDPVYGLTGEQIPDWLLGSAESSDVEEEPDWLMAADITSEEKEAAELEEIPDWLKAEAAAEEAVSEFDWEVADVGADIESEIGADIESEVGEAEPFDETADWLTDFEETEQSGGEWAAAEWMEASPELIVGQTDIDQDSLPDWLDGGGREDVVREEILMGNSEEQDKKEPDIPEDLDEAMKWLEELAAAQGADLAELPSLQEDPSTTEGPSLQEEESTGQASAVRDDDIPDWFKDDLSDGDLSTEDDLPDWLKNEAASMSDVDWLTLADEQELSELEMTIFDSVDSGGDSPVHPADDIPDWLKAQMPEGMEYGIGEESEGDDLGWLDQIAAGEGAAIEELPTLSWDDDPEDMVSTQVPDDPDEAMAWLEQLAAQQGAPLDELPTMEDEIPSFSEIDEPVIDESAVLEFDHDVPTVFDLPEDAAPEPMSEMEMPDDPDEVMAWLEQLASRQGAPLNELPTMPGFEEASEAADVPEMDFSEIPTVIDIPEVGESEAEAEMPTFEIPDDPDEAMAWLEQLAAQQGAPLEELPSFDVVTEMRTPVTGIVAEEEDFELPDFEPMDLETADLETADYELEAVAEPEFDPELEMALAELSEIDMPEDDAEALAWLAAIMGGETPGAVEAEVTAEEIVAEEVIVEEVVVEEVTAEAFPFAQLEPDYEEPAEASLFDAIEDETDQFINLQDDLPVAMESELEESDLDSALPDWLQFGGVGETSADGLDWLESFGESDVDSWLEAEEQTTQVELPVAMDTAELEPAAYREPELLEEPEQFEEEAFAVEAVPSGPVDQSQLESARSALEIGDYSSALEQYNSLLQSGQGLPMLIADLETASNRHSNIAPLQRLLGDAYMQNGQLQKAIDIYRQALDNL